MARAVAAGRARVQAVDHRPATTVCVRDGVLAWRRRPDGTHESKAEDIAQLQKAGYFVVLAFVGLAFPAMSVARVGTRMRQGGHRVPTDKLNARFPRTQAAVGHAAPLADMTLFFDNGRSFAEAFALARVQYKTKLLFDCRDLAHPDSALRSAAGAWLNNVVGPYVPS